MPLVGAAIGEFIAQRDALRAGKIGLATWLGLLLAPPPRSPSRSR